jgi:protein arginine N-methyltransferase 7
MSTHPDATRDNFPRDMQWGQGLQLIEDLAGASAEAAPKPFNVTEGEWLVLVTRFSADGVTLQFQLERDAPSVD